jgi:uncharacterized membrane protein (UPF0127 family)
MSPAHFLAPAVGCKGTWGLKVARTGRWLATNAELAGNSTSRRKGLLGQDGLPHDRALVIAPTQGVHTFGMRFAIDIIGVSYSGVVVSIREAVPRRRIVLSWRAFAIVELAEGAARRADLKIGDKLVADPDPIPPT